MERLFKAMILLGTAGIFAILVGAGFVYILSGGDPARFVQTSLLRIQLSSRQADLNQPFGTDDQPRRFTIRSGDTPPAIGRALVSAGLIEDADLFVAYVRVEGLDTELEAGTYFLRQTQTLPEIARQLTDSRNSSITFQILAGMRIEEVAARISATRLFAFSGADFLELVGPGAEIPAEFAARMGIPAGSSLEGFLYPDTYILPPEITAIELRDLLLEAFQNAIGTQLLIDAQAQGLTMFQAVTFASIIEREAVWDDEHPLISSVYRNRYAINMKLDADPTVQYALNGARGSWWPRITVADYRGVISPYNTYLGPGLPPGPIASPGLSAIRAAIYPVESSYFYFRARCDGSNYHVFATTYEQHLANGC